MTESKGRVILTHEHTDFDGLAALLAAAKLYPHAIPIVPQQPNRNLRAFLSVYWDELPFLRREDFPRQKVEEAILVDTQSASPVKGMGDWTRYKIIDHHPLDTELEEGSTYHGEELGATTTMLVEEIQEHGIHLSSIEATLLLLGIYEDTGSLSYTTTTPRDVYAAGWLLEIGAHPSLLNRYLHHPLSEEQIAIYTRLVNEGTMRRIQGYDIFISALALEHHVEELSTLAHKVNDILDPDASFLLFQYGDDVQLIARSATEAVDVGEIAQQLGGGGHSKAAAAVIQETPLSEARQRVTNLLSRHVRPPVMVKDIMSFGVRTLQPNMSVQAAEDEARKYGHEGFPVLDDGELVGVITRKEIERALYHHLDEAPIKRYMRQGDIHVQPDDPIDRVPEVMTQYDVGQVPVVEGGQVLGIVTRTDLVKQLVASNQSKRRQEIVDKMEATIPAPRRELILDARDVANDLGYSLYIVGGFVRDLLLGIPDIDVDLVVEGDAIRVAQRLADEIGGRVRSHRRFGTAKLILKGTQGTNLPESLDLATARIEFYEPNRPSLPRVEGSSIQKDLERRDFTINTLAICLDKGRYGELLDHFGGVHDLEAGLIRVLHYLSFIEDPTRILRAVRLEQRLDFLIEPQTAERIRFDLEQLSRVSGARLRSELALILQEQEPEKSWARLAEFDAFAHIHPVLGNDPWIQQKLPELRKHWDAWVRAKIEGSGDGARMIAQDVAAHRDAERMPPTELSWCLVSYHADRGELRSLAARLKFSNALLRLLLECQAVKEVLPKLAKKPAPSEMDALLEPYSELALLATYVATDDQTVCDVIALYQSHLRWIKPHLDGHDLRELGLEPGPIYKEILSALRAAVLDNEVQTRAEEEALVKRMIRELDGDYSE